MTQKVGAVDRVAVGVVMDPIQSINPKKDSTLAMLIAAQAKDWTLSYMEQADLFIRDGEVWVRRKELSVKDDLEDWYSLGKESIVPASDFDVILMRIDPPFDMEFIYTTYLLERVESSGTLIVNRPGSIRDCNEKLFATQFPQCCPPHIVSKDMTLLKEFYQEQHDVVFKPLDGMGGSSVFRVKHDDPNVNVILEILTGHGARQIMGQKYIPEIVEGDTRILLIDGKPIPFGLARIPQKGESRGNLAAGGKGVGRELVERDLWICEQLGPALSQKGLLFVGIDVIGEYLTEINVTCPTCIRELDREFDLDIAGQLMECIAGRLPGLL